MTLCILSTQWYTPAASYLFAKVLSYKTQYNILHSECHFFIFKSQSMIYFFKSLSPLSIEKRPRRLKLEIEIQWHFTCNRMFIEFFQVRIYLKFVFSNFEESISSIIRVLFISKNVMSHLIFPPFKKENTIQAVCSPLLRSRQVIQITSTEALLLNASLESFSPSVNW